MEFLTFIALYLMAVILSVVLRKRKTMLKALVPCLAVLSNIMGSAKILSMPIGLTAPAGIIPFMLSFFLIDVINEFFSERDARESVISGLIAVGVSVLVIEAVLLWRPAPFSPEGFGELFALSPRLFIASLLSFGASSYLNVVIYSAIRDRTGKRAMWFRENISTIVSVLVSNLVFLPAGYYGTGYPVLNMIAGHTVTQTIIALLDTPFIYSVKHIYERMDISEIKKKLKEKSFVVVREGSIIFESDGRGLRPFVDAIDSVDLDGAMIGDRMVGKASALLSCYAKPAMLYTPSITDEALEILEKEGINVRYDSIVKMPACVYDAALSGIEGPEDAYGIIRRMIYDERE
jgi:uncharacterized integral membrane protein (TIGR00697 family)